MVDRHENISDALIILQSVGMPRAQLNDRTALVLLALSGVDRNKSFGESQPVRKGVTEIMDWISESYQLKYAPNTRETIRRQSLHQMEQAQLVRINPDIPRPTNSPKTIYALTEPFLELLRCFNNPKWDMALSDFLAKQTELTKQYDWERTQELIPVVSSDGKKFSLSAGSHSELIRDIIEQFGPRFASGSTVVYVGDTGSKYLVYEPDLLKRLGIDMDPHGKFPDVILYDEARNWLYLIESVTSHGPINPKRHIELSALFAPGAAGLIFITAFPDSKTFSRNMDIAWETEVWLADTPSHLIHFNGDRFTGPR